MSEFKREIDARVREAFDTLTRARAESDDFLTDIQLSELQSLYRLAVDHGLDVAFPPTALIDLRESVQTAFV